MQAMPPSALTAQGDAVARADAPVPPPMVAIERLSFRWSERAVLHDLSLMVGPGEFVGLLGPNGSGKSTLLRLIAGLLRPAAGMVRTAGLDPGPRTRRALARQVAFVSQTQIVPMTFTVAELVLLGRLPHLGPLAAERDSDREAVWRALEATNCVDLTNRRLGELSGGERQRAILARALAQEPALLLLDEPTAHLDPGVAQELVGTLVRLNRERGLTIIAAFHDLNLAAVAAPRLLLLHEGRLVRDGAPATVLTDAALQRVYGRGVQVVAHPQSGAPVVLPAYADPRAPR